MRLTWFLIELNNPDSLLVMKNDLFWNLRLQPKNPSQGHAPSDAAKTRIWFQQCYQNIVTKNFTFTASFHARLTGYSDVVT